MMQQLNCLFGNTVSLGHPVMEIFEMMINCLFFLRHICIFVESDDCIVNITDNYSTLEVNIGQLTRMAAQRKIYSAFSDGSVKVQISSDVKSTHDPMTT